jgi:ribosome maturation factor RimP
MDHIARQNVQSAVRALLEPTVERLGLELVGVEMTGDQSGPILRLTLDKPGGVDVADCSRVTRAVSPELDAADPVPGAYRLEVSSPGMERPVQKRSDFLRFVGFRFKLRFNPGTPRKRMSGHLLAVEEENLRMEVDGQQHIVPITEIDRANLDLTMEEFLQLGEVGLPQVEGVQP